MSTRTTTPDRSRGTARTDAPVTDQRAAAAQQRRAGGVPQTFGHVLRAEWIKFWSVRSTTWSLVALVVLGVGLTTLVCALSAESLAESGDESPGSFVTWGMMIAQVTAVVLGALVVTSEYGTGMARATFAAVPRRGRVVLAKALVLTAVLLVAGTLTATAGYFAGNWFLTAEGIGVPLDGDGVVRSLYGNGLYLAALGLFTMAVGLLVRSTAGTLSTVLALVFVVGNMAVLLPDAWGEWVSKLMPSNAGAGITSPVPFNPTLLDAWPGFGVLMVEVLLVLGAAWYAVQRRDA